MRESDVNLKLIREKFSKITPLNVTYVFVAVFYLPFIFLKYDFHDSFHWYLDGKEPCLMEPQTFPYFMFGRPIGAVWNCLIVQGTHSTIASGGITRAVTTLLLCLLLLLIDLKLRKSSLNWKQRTTILVAICGVYGVQETIFWTTTSFVMLALILAAIADYVYHSKIRCRRVLAFILLVMSLSTYQFQAALFLIFQYLAWKESFGRNTRVYLASVAFYISACIAYLLGVKFYLSIFKSLGIGNTFDTGERSITFKAVFEWPKSLFNHLYFDLNIFGPFIPIWVIFLIVILAIALPLKMPRIKSISVRNLVAVCATGLLISTPIVVSRDETLFFRTDIVLQLFLIIVFVMSIGSRAVTSMLVITVIISSFSVILTFINVGLNLNHEYKSLHKIDFQTTPLCVTAASVKPKLFTPLGMNLPRAYVDEWGTYTTNYDFDLVPLLVAIYREKRTPINYGNSAPNILISSLNTKAELSQCSEILSLDGLIQEK
jgi:hypothetical protein